MKQLDAFSQIAFEYWKDTALDHAKRRISFNDANTTGMRSLLDSIRVETRIMMQENISGDVRNIKSDYDESFIRSMFSQAVSCIDYNAVADRICYDYIPKELGIAVRRSVTTMLTTNKKKKMGANRWTITLSTT